MANKITITVWLSGRGYKLKVEPDKEEQIRKAVRIAEQKINQLKIQFKGKDEQDFLALCLLMYVTDQVRDEESMNITQDASVMEMIANIEEILPK